ncbi:hypothetical protein [Mucilaginibacter sp.]|uniref:hypothetical protein n=1 Tax=Mucilaginibacter sp. TaxID=1882438 RepID=UPI0032640989
MKQQLFYRSPGINENEGGDDEQPVDDTSTDAGEETNGEDGATDEDATVGEDTGSDEGATDDNPTSDEETNSDEGATDENPTSDEETNSDEGATDENPTSDEDTGSDEGATDENNGSGEETTDENATPEDDTNSDESAVDENNTEGPEAETEENNTEEGANIEGQEAEHEENNTEEGNTTEGQQSENGEGNSEEEEHESHEIENETVHNDGQEAGTEETNTVSTPPVAVAWPGNLSQSPVTSPGDELATFITAIKANRANVPDHLTDKNKVKNGYMYDPFSGKPQPQPASIQPNTVEAWIWEELRSEGSYTSINTYDNMVVTWGRGVAGANIAKVLKSVFGAHSDIQTEFNNVGVALNANGILQVVDTTQNCVKEGSFALQIIKADKKLLDFLVDISLNDKYKEVFLDAQWNFVKTFNANLIAHVNASKWSKDAVQLMFHFNWWLPAYGWNGHPQNYKDTGGDVSKIIYIFAGNLKKNSVLVGYLKKFAGNAFSKYVAKPEYQGQPSGENIVFEDGGKTYYLPKL